jgi:tetratricopeptide (TPR) repeat protein
MVDDALARATHGATTWIRKHFNLIQWAIVIGIAGGIGYQIWSWRHGKTVAKASDTLFAAVTAEQGRVGTAAEAGKPDPMTGLVDPTPVFATDEARLAEANKKYQEAIELRKGSGTAILAKLGLAGVLYDQGKYDEAISAYEEVKSSELAKHDADVRLRAAEGIGLAREAKGDLDGALKAFKELENADVVGFKGLSLLHQARVHFAKGDKTKAKELAKGAQEQTNTERSPYQTAGYLDSAARELLAAIDPSTIPPSPAAAGYAPEQMDALREQIMKDPTKLQKMLQEMGKSVPKVPDVPMPPMPMPAPQGSGAP